ncbi:MULTISPECIES: [protein-PII] uridylyltransferase [unclassified Pseudofrankia]|uniref:[protein-PII] uridylyltransferase n=1 Tax=unclassified Pseudofrankia TaxID=2994372 RepID=UPI0008DA1984|nr:MULTISPECIES: [protein-PII] uridylyltransferase [unclassified Pseudofrankia]MDT3438713.1 [protein-PII] uridylyltransferase [Pseudofrankia sp. BMG5.37]OHV56522.1 [protein-PII] uridylyltransferase [Pseudofrankia sp. BMG5.36]
MAAELAALRGRDGAFPDLIGAPLRVALTERADVALRALFGDPGPGVALLAVGGYGRGEPAFGTDLDLVLLHDGRRGARAVAAVADGIWYPVWDAGVGLDHSVRTVEQAVSVADGDMKAALGLLDARLVAGDEALATRLAEAVRARWRARASRRLPELAELHAERARRAGEVAFLLEPDLKESRGGLRDVQALHALAAAWVAEAPGERVLAAQRMLLDVRGEVRRLAAGRDQDRLLLQDGTSVAAALGYRAEPAEPTGSGGTREPAQPGEPAELGRPGALGEPDSFALAHAIADAGRTISWTWDTTWHRVSAALRSQSRWRSRRPVRRPLAAGVVEQDGEVLLARDADPAADPALVLRAAAAAARAGIPLGRFAVDRFARETPPLPDPWPGAARDAFVALLAAGDNAVPVLESLDQVGLLTRILPEWAAVRSRPQRNPYHRYTVDRHLMETAARAADHTREVDRPDLLLLGALLHDIGKGYPGDHTDAGIVIVEKLGPRLGLPPADVDVLIAMVRHHLLLPDAATHRDIDDPATIEAVAAAAGSTQVLTLLHKLTQADSQATGATAWSAWKARLINDLVTRALAVLGGGPVPYPGELTDRQRALLELPDEHLVQVNGLPDEGMYEIVVLAPDHVGLLAVTTGVLALNRLDVRRASARGANGRALLQAAVAGRHGREPDASRLLADVRRGLEGRLDVGGQLTAREEAYATRRPWRTPGPPRATFDDSGSRTVLEVRAPDRAGVLFRIVGALAGAGVDVRTAIVATIGLDVVDAFYIQEPDGAEVVGEARRREVTDAVLAALASEEPPAA